MNNEPQVPGLPELARIAKALEKLVELKTPKKSKTTELATYHVELVTDAEKAGKKMGEAIGKAFTEKAEERKEAWESVQRKWHTGIERDAEKAKDWRADTTELQREKNKLTVRIAEIEAELKRRDQK